MRKDQAHCPKRNTKLKSPQIWKKFIHCGLSLHTYFLLYNDNFQHVVAPNDEPEKYLQGSGIDISELVHTSYFSKLQGDSIHWDLFM